MHVFFLSGLSIECLELPGQPRFRVRHAGQQLGRRRPREVGEARKLRQCVPRVRRGERRRQRRGSHRLLARSPRRDLVLEQGQRPLQGRVTKDGGRLVHQREVGTRTRRRRRHSPGRESFHFILCLFHRKVSIKSK